ncbi:MAG: hypothetical protein ACLTKE_08705 [Coprococcus sp.]
MQNNVGIYGMMIGISIVYLIGCVVVKVVTWKQKSRGKGERCGKNSLRWNERFGRRGTRSSGYRES